MVSQEQFLMIRLLAEAIFPGAAEARVHEFIARDMHSNPFMANVYSHGLRRLEEEAAALYRTSLLELDREQLTGLLRRNEETAFFRFVRDHTLEGMFSDPIYGGNYEAYGWKMLGYAGPVYHPPETLDAANPPTVYYSLEGIAYEGKAEL